MRAQRHFLAGVLLNPTCRAAQDFLLPHLPMLNSLFFLLLVYLFKID